jgi:hypothetical protein
MQLPEHMVTAVKTVVCRQQIIASTIHLLQTVVALLPCTPTQVEFCFTLAAAAVHPITVMAAKPVMQV